MKNSKTALLAAGLRAGETDMYNEDEIWSRCSGDKPDIGRSLAAVLRNLARALPLSRKLRSLSIGSGSEPQFRILQAAGLGGLFLLDIDVTAAGSGRRSPGIFTGSSGRSSSP